MTIEREWTSPGYRTPNTVCQDEVCTEVGFECYLPDGTVYVYCDTHAPEHGFCRLCGSFEGGIESFEFRNPLSGHAGLCDDCVFQVQDACGELDDDEDDDYDPEDD